MVYSTGGTENTYTAVSTAESIVNKINSVGDPTPDKKALVESIRREYNNLPDDQKESADGRFQSQNPAADPVPAPAQPSR